MNTSNGKDLLPPLEYQTGGDVDRASAVHARRLTSRVVPRGGGTRRRNTGIEVVGEVPWGTHLCLLYASKEGLCEILVPYFQAGLENDEGCVWITSPLVSVTDAWEALARAMPDLDSYRERGRIEIIPHTEFYLVEGVFDPTRVLEAGGAKFESLLAAGCAGMRSAGDAFWLEQADWKRFADYEAVVDRSHASSRILALCAYPLERCGAAEVVDLIQNHEIAVIQRGGRWERFDGFGHRSAEEALKLETDRFTAALQCTGDAFIVTDQEGRIRTLNGVAEQLTGWTEAEAASRLLSDIFHVVDERTGARVQDPLLNVLEYEAVLDLGRAAELVARDGRRLAIAHSAAPVRSRRGTPLGAVLVFRDLSPERQAARERESTARFLQLVNAQPTTAELVQAAESFFQQESGCEAVELRFGDGGNDGNGDAPGARAEPACAEGNLCGPEDDGLVDGDGGLDCALEGLQGDVLCGTCDTAQSYFTEGGSFWSNHATRLLPKATYADPWSETRKRDEGYESVALVPLRAGDECLGLLHLNDRRKGMFSAASTAHWERLARHLAEAVARLRAEEALRRTKERLSRAEAIAHLGCWESEVRGDHEWWSEEVYRIFGVEPHEVEATYANFLSVVHPDDRARVNAAYAESLKAGRDERGIEYRVVRRTNREVRWVRSKCEHVRDATGRVIRSSGMVEDITERKAMEQALRESERRYRSLFEMMNEGFCLTELVYDERGKPCDVRFLEVNPTFQRHTGLKPAEVLGRTARELFPGADGKWLEHFSGVMLSGEPVHFQGQLGPRGQWFEVSSYRTEPGRLAVISFDITERKQAEQSLAFQAALLSSAYEPIIAVNEKRLINYWNKAAEETFGWTADEALGVPAVALFELDFLGPSGPEVLEELMQTGHREGEYQCRCKDGGYLTVDARSAPVRGPNGQLRGIVSSVRDITERKRAEDVVRTTMQRFYMVLASTYSGMLLMTNDGKVEFVNSAFCDFFGLEEAPADLLGLGAREIIARIQHGFLDPDEAVRRIFELVRRGEPVKGHELTMRNGRTALGDFVPLNVEGRPCGRLWVHFDITELRAAERRLAYLASFPEKNVNPIVEVDLGGQVHYANPAALRLFPDVHDKGLKHPWLSGWDSVNDSARAHVPQFKIRDVTIDERSYRQELHYVGESDLVRIYGIDITDRKQTEEALQACNAELAAVDQRRREFIAMLSHELRTPLAPIANSLVILDHATPGGEEANRAKAVIVRQVAQLTRLVDDLLDVTRLSRGKLRLERSHFDLVETVAHAAEDHRATFAELGVSLEARTGARPVWVDGDRARMTQLVANLLTNAAKFTPTGGKVTLELEPAPEGAMAILRVRDTGVGISPSMLDKLFEPFTQAEESLDRSKGGLGLGLALVKGIVEMHGGWIEAGSDGPGTGAEFVVHLPAAAARAAPERADDDPPSRPGSRRVLVIEDNEDAADTLRCVLELCGHRAEVAHEGVGAIQKARDFKPHVVLCDIGLPGMTGYQVAEAFRTDEALRAVRLVALTGYATADDRQRALAAGFEHHLAKPPTFEKLERLFASMFPPATPDPPP